MKPIFQRRNIPLAFLEQTFQRIASKVSICILRAQAQINNLPIEIVNDDARYPVVLNAVVINERQPFEFNGLRYFLTFTVLLLLYVFRAGLSIYRCRVKEHPEIFRACIVLATACEVFVLTAYLLLGSNQVGIATANYNLGSWDGHSIVNTYKVGGDNAAAIC